MGRLALTLGPRSELVPLRGWGSLEPLVHLKKQIGSSFLKYCLLASPNVLNPIPNSFDSWELGLVLAAAESEYACYFLNIVIATEEIQRDRTSRTILL